MVPGYYRYTTARNDAKTGEIKRYRIAERGVCPGKTIF